MKNLFGIFLMFFALPVFSQCKESGLKAWPYSDVISQNPVIVLMGYSEAEATIFDLNKTNRIFLKNGADTVDLKIEEYLYGQFNISQVILKPAEKLTIGSTYELIVENLKNKEFLPKKYDKTTNGLVKAEWKVVAESDSLSPSWNKKPREKEKQVIPSGCQAQKFIVYSYENAGSDEHLVRVTVKNGKTNKSFTCLVIPTNNEIKVGHGDCVGEFYLDFDVKYSVDFQLMDYAGNASSWSGEKTFLVKPPTY